MIHVLNVKDLQFQYGMQPVLKDISFQVGQGQLCGLFGPNGCGKTTLFKCCLKFLKNQGGQIKVDGQDIKNLRIEEMAKLVAYVPQEHKPPFPYLVKDVVLMGRTPRLKSLFGTNKEDRQKALGALKLLGLLEIADKPYNQLSGGQRQMVLIARAVAQETPLMFLDEPTSALDFSNQIRIWRIMKQIAESGVTILACSHDPNHVSWYCDRVVVMNHNHILREGPPQEVITETVLDEIYRNVCAVRNLDGARMVLPKEVARGNGARKHNY
ncbi:MAG: ABC transporter ATP-binding protein [Methanothrix sp.]|nr:ABC transporter ATP-binding protein [Methanothrix sp.]